jgi:hypothetical protein
VGDRAGLDCSLGDHVLAQIDADETDYRFPMAVADAPTLRDLRLEVRCKPVSGKTDEACGLVFRSRDPDNYYVARANALEDNVNLYQVVKGRRRQITGWSGKVAPNAWHPLAIEARGVRMEKIIVPMKVTAGRHSFRATTAKIRALER